MSHAAEHAVGHLRAGRGRCSELHTWKGDWRSQRTDITGEKWQRLKKTRNRFRTNLLKSFHKPGVGLKARQSSVFRV